MSTKGKARLLALAFSVTTTMLTGITWAGSHVALDQTTAAYCAYDYVCSPWGCFYRWVCW